MCECLCRQETSLVRHVSPEHRRLGKCAQKPCLPMNGWGGSCMTVRVGMQGPLHCCWSATSAQAGKTGLSWWQSLGLCGGAASVRLPRGTRSSRTICRYSSLAPLGHHPRAAYYGTLFFWASWAGVPGLCSTAPPSVPPPEQRLVG